MNLLLPIFIVALSVVIVLVAILCLLDRLWTTKGWSDKAWKVWVPMIMAILFMLSLYPIAFVTVKIIDGAKITDTSVALPAVTQTEYKLWNADFDDDDEHCLALNIYFEARGEEDIRGQYAVADVVMYRFMHADYPDDICEVVQEGYYHDWKPDLPVKHMCQFSWFCDGKSDKPLDTMSFEKAIDIAQVVLHDPGYEPRVEFSLFYHSNTVNPYWVSSMEFVETIGNHSFYTDKKLGHNVP